MKEKLKSWIIPIIIVIVLFIPIVTNYYKEKRVDLIDYDELTDMIDTGEFSLVYLGSPKEKEFSSIEENLVSIKNNYEVSTSALDINKLSNEEVKELLLLNDDLEKSDAYLFIVDGEVKKVTTNNDIEELEKLVDRYVNNVIPEDEIAYKTVSTYKEFAKLLESKNIIMHVFGRNSCGWCNKFKPVYNDMASKYKLNIYYYDSDSFDKTEYNKIINTKINIPAECSTKKEEVPLSSGFATPLTLFTKKGKVIGCISGYTNEKNLEQKLKSVGMIK